MGSGTLSLEDPFDRQSPEAMVRDLGSPAHKQNQQRAHCAAWQV
jgi:hypothetical protein